MRHLTPAVTSDWLYRLPERFRSDSIPDRALSAASGPSLTSRAGSDRPSPVTSLADGLQTGEGTLHRGRAIPGSLISRPPSAPVKPLSMSVYQGPPLKVPARALIGHLRGELGGSDVERSSAVTPFGEVRGPERAAR